MNHDLNEARDDRALAREIKRRVDDLGAFVPSAPPLAQIEGVTGRGLMPVRPARRLAPGPRMSAALLGIALVVVVILGSGALRTSQPVGPLANKSPDASASLSASAHPSWSPPVEPTPTLPPGLIFEGQEADQVAWSPSGDRIAVVDGLSGEVLTTYILDPNGTVEDQFHAADFAWVNDSTYVAFATDATQANPTAFVGRVGSSSRQTIPGSYYWLLGGPTGAVALVIQEAAGADHYRVWRDGQLSELRDGVPVAFSPDGSMLAVVHYPVACCAGVPSPEPTVPPGPPTLDVTRVDTGAPLATNPEVEWAYGAYLAFSPDSRMIAFVMYPKNMTGPERVGLIDIESGRLWVVAPMTADAYGPGTPVWLGSDRLEIPGWSGGSSDAGIPVALTYSSEPGRVVARSPDGRVASVGPDETTVTVVGGPLPVTIVTYKLSVPVVGLFWSPDGESLLVSCFDSHKIPRNPGLYLFKP